MAAILRLPIHSSAVSLCYLTSLQNRSDFVVSLYCGLNLLFHISNRLSSLLHVSCSACIRVSMSCRPCLSSQFFITDTLSVWLILKFGACFYFYCVCYIFIGIFLLICHLCFFVWLLLYFAFESSLWVCLVLSSWFAETAYFESAYYFLFEHADVRLLIWACLIFCAWICLCVTFYSWHQWRVSCLIEDNTDVFLNVYLLVYANNYYLQ